MGREFELKFRADPAAFAAIRAATPGLSPMEMETTYFDTPDRSLRRKKWTLRRRMENGVSVCTLKTPLADGSRGEWETVCGEIGAGITELCKLGAPEELLTLTREGLEEVCSARFTRLAARLDVEGGQVELALDQGFLMGGSRRCAFTEVEVELKSGSDAAALAFAAALAEKYGLQPERKSKYARALALREG